MFEDEIRVRTQELLNAYYELTGEEPVLGIDGFLNLRSAAVHELQMGIRSSAACPKDRQMPPQENVSARPDKPVVDRQSIDPQPYAQNRKTAVRRNDSPSETKANAWESHVYDTEREKEEDKEYSGESMEEEDEIDATDFLASLPLKGWGT